MMNDKRSTIISSILLNRSRIETLLAFIMLFIMTTYSLAQNTDSIPCDKCTDTTKKWYTHCDTVDISFSSVASPCFVKICYKLRICNGFKEVRFLGLTVPPCADFESA